MLFHVQKGNSFILYDILHGAELIQIEENITIFFPLIISCPWIPENELH